MNAAKSRPTYPKTAKGSSPLCPKMLRLPPTDHYADTDEPANLNIHFFECKKYFL